MSEPFDHGLDLQVDTDPIGFTYGPTCFGPVTERRLLDDIRPSLLDPQCAGPDIVYAIAMDVGATSRRADLEQRNVCFGVVTYAAGTLGREPVRSQGHVHRRSPRTGLSTPEVYEIWAGRAVILMQEHDTDHPGRCFAVGAGSGEVVIVPPGWAHATISADPTTPLTFGAWCDRDYGFEYSGLRSHRGLAWYPTVDGDRLAFAHNDHYERTPLIEKPPEGYALLGLTPGVSIWRQYIDDPDRFDFVPDPRRAGDVWESFVP